MVSLFGVISTRMSSSSGAAKLLVLLFALTFATMELAYAEKKMLFFFVFSFYFESPRKFEDFSRVQDLM